MPRSVTRKLDWCKNLFSSDGLRCTHENENSLSCAAETNCEKIPSATDHIDC